MESDTKNRIKEIGAILECECSECHEKSWLKFCSYEKPSGSFFTALKNVLIKSEYPPHAIYCMSCYNFHEVFPEDVKMVTLLSEMAEAVIAEEFDKKDYIKAVVESEIRCLYDILNSGQSWTCDCGEKNAIIYDSCWQCQAPRPEIKAEDTSEEEVESSVTEDDQVTKPGES